MKKIILIIIFFTPFIVQSQDRGTIKDSRDGKTYPWVRIGSQVWMAKNLNYKTNSSYCYQNEKSKCDKYGRLYNWEEARYTACPSGWHLPTDNDWKILEGITDSKYSVGNNEWDKDSPRGYDVGTNLKSKTNWEINSGTDIFCFEGLPGGFISERGDHILLGNVGAWWTATPSSNNYRAWSRRLNFCWPVTSRSGEKMGCYLSIRCVKDK